MVAKSVRLGASAARDLGAIHEEAERRLGFRMSDTQAAAFGFVELCRLWANASMATFGTLHERMPNVVGVADDPDEEPPTNNEHPFDA